MCLTALLLLFAFPVHADMQSGTAKAVNPAVEQHIQQVIKELPSDSQLRRELLDGFRGNGVRYGWMDEMRKQGLKRVIVYVGIEFDRHGKPRHMKVNRIHFFSQYASEAPISSSLRLEAIRASGLEKELDDLALARAAEGAWIDVPRPKPHPFAGSAKIEFLEDEWLPARQRPLFCACQL